MRDDTLMRTVKKTHNIKLRENVSRANGIETLMRTENGPQH